MTHTNAGSPATSVIDLSNHDEELAELHELSEAARQRGAPAVAKLPEFKAMTAASRGPAKLRRLALLALQCYLDGMTAESHDWRWLHVLSTLLSALLDKKLPLDDAYLLGQLRLFESLSAGVPVHAVDIAPLVVRNVAAYVEQGHALPADAA